MGEEQVEIKMENLGTIKKGCIRYHVGTLNVKYGLNGTGKSTISDAIVALSKHESLSSYKTFGKDVTPNVSIRSFSGENVENSTEIQLNNVAVFNTDYVNQYPFDFIIGSVHNPKNVDPYYPEYFEGRSEEEAYREYFIESLACLKAFSDFDSLGHMDYVVR